MLGFGAAGITSDASAPKGKLEDGGAAWPGVAQAGGAGTSDFKADGSCCRDAQVINSVAGASASHIKCFKCHKYGHYANRCPGEEKKKEEAHHASAVEYEPTVLLVETALPRMLEHPSSDGLLSDGC
jgi:hypothetical protein